MNSYLLPYFSAPTSCHIDAADGAHKGSRISPAKIILGIDIGGSRPSNLGDSLIWLPLLHGYVGGADLKTPEVLDTLRPLLPSVNEIHAGDLVRKDYRRGGMRKEAEC